VSSAAEQTEIIFFAGKVEGEIFLYPKIQVKEIQLFMA
jgi:hypothetical protein